MSFIDQSFEDLFDSVAVVSDHRVGFYSFNFSVKDNDWSVLQGFVLKVITFKAGGHDNQAIYVPFNKRLKVELFLFDGSSGGGNNHGIPMFSQNAADRLYNFHEIEVC